MEFGQRAAAALALTIVVAKFNLVLLATGSATFVFWGPVLGAINRNRILRNSGRYRPVLSLGAYISLLSFGSIPEEQHTTYIPSISVVNLSQNIELSGVGLKGLFPFFVPTIVLVSPKERLPGLMQRQ